MAVIVPRATINVTVPCIGSARLCCLRVCFNRLRADKGLVRHWRRDRVCQEHLLVFFFSRHEGETTRLQVVGFTKRENLEGTPFFVRRGEGLLRRRKDLEKRAKPSFLPDQFACLRNKLRTVRTSTHTHDPQPTTHGANSVRTT